MVFMWSIIILVLTFFHSGNCIWCFECVSTQPGCGIPFNWFLMWSNVCPESNDVCVKVIERVGAEEVITRSCLSTIQAFRTDIPADRYEGCRPAAVDVQLGHYVNNSIKELDIYRKYYDNTTFCFCFLDHRCNESPVNTASSVIILLIGVSTILFNKILIS